MMSRARYWGLWARLGLFTAIALIWVNQRNTAVVESLVLVTPTADVGVKSTQPTRNFNTVVEPVGNTVSKSVSAGLDRTTSSTEGTTASVLFGENLRKLLNSDRLKSADYATMRLKTACSGSLVLGSSRAESLIQKTADEKKVLPGERILVGGASYEMRLSAISRFDQLCSKILNGMPLTDSEFAAHNTKPEMDRWRMIARAARSELLDLSNQQTKVALDTVVATPLYGVLEGLLYSKLDYSELTKAYPNYDPNSLPNFVVPILLCRMGDDCGSEGYLTLQLCHNNGICGNDVETAIWAHLESHRLNTAMLRQFIDQRQQALNLLDFSILKKPK